MFLCTSIKYTFSLVFAQPSKNPIRVQDLKILCAENEQTRTCWTSAFRLFKVLSIFMQETPWLSFYFPCVLTTVLCAVSTGSSFSVTMRCPKQLHKKWKDPNWQMAKWAPHTWCTEFEPLWIVLSCSCSSFICVGSQSRRLAWWPWTSLGRLAGGSSRTRWKPRAQSGRRGLHGG